MTELYTILYKYRVSNVFEIWHIYIVSITYICIHNNEYFFEGEYCDPTLLVYGISNEVDVLSLFSSADTHTEFNDRFL